MLSKVVRQVNHFVSGARNNRIWDVPNPRHSDIYLVSYPKSGNTWMRYLIAYATWPDLTDLDLVEMAAYIPSFRIEHDSVMMLDPDSPCNQLKHRIIKEHTVYNKRAARNVKRAIYIVRDGRDAIVSYWHFCNQRDGTLISFNDFLESSAKPEHSYGPWREHVQGWLDAPLEAKLVLRYEDMLTNTEFCLRQALDFAEIDATDNVIEKAVERASFNSMRKLEKTKGFNLDQLKNVKFVRMGKTGTWKDVFGQRDLEHFEKFHGGSAPELGYDW